MEGANKAKNVLKFLLTVSDLLVLLSSNAARLVTKNGMYSNIIKPM
jgi:hypothetical protein